MNHVNIQLYFFDFRREALQMLMGRLWMEICPVGRVDATPAKTHRRQTVQVRSLRKEFLQIGPFGLAHEKASSIRPTSVTCVERLWNVWKREERKTSSLPWDHYENPVWYKQINNILLLCITHIKVTDLTRRGQKMCHTDMTCEKFVYAFFAYTQAVISKRDKLKKGWEQKRKNKSPKYYDQV